ncbi:MAG TPA: ANTAR domain-containing protein [Burkholderiaceae bacterium]|nr:ANTAR domain-containing protein [Burkholderiaceae bacterium]
MPAAATRRLSVLIVTDPDAVRSGQAHAIAQGLADSGSLVLGVRAGDATLPEAIAQLKPDVVVVRSDAGVRDVLEHIAVATQHRRRPIALFTDSEDRPTMRDALGAGVSAYVVKGANRERVRAVIDVAVERFAAEEALRLELASTKTELADRKLIDRAKRLLVEKKALSEAQAHRLLQDLAMKKGIRLRDAAERVIDLESLLG